MSKQSNQKYRKEKDKRTYSKIDNNATSRNITNSTNTNVSTQNNAPDGDLSIPSTSTVDKQAE